MKSLLFVVLSLICIQGSAFTGKPSKDRVVADLKAQFISGNAPAFSMLVGDYDCRFEDAYGASAKTTSFHTNISKRGENRLFLGNMEIFYTPDGNLMGRIKYKDGATDYYLRSNRENVVIIEGITTFPSWWIFQDFVFDRAVVNKKMFAVEYGICTKRN